MLLSIQFAKFPYNLKKEKRNVNSHISVQFLFSIGKKSSQQTQTALAVVRKNCSIRPTKNISLKTALRKSFVRFIRVWSRTVHTCHGMRCGGGRQMTANGTGRHWTTLDGAGRPATRKSIPNSTLVAGRSLPTVPAVCCNALST